MKMNISIPNDVRKEYLSSDFSKLEQGKHYKRVVSRSNIVIFAFGFLFHY